MKPRQATFLKGYLKQIRISIHPKEQEEAKAEALLGGHTWRGRDRISSKQREEELLPTISRNWTGFWIDVPDRLGVSR
jgi:hypothetical protein